MSYFYFLLYQIVYPILFVFVQNIDEAALIDLLLPFYVFLGLGAILFFVLRIGRWNLKLLSILSFGLFLFFSYGHFYNLIRDYKFSGIIVGTNTNALLVLGLIYLIFIGLIYKKLIDPKSFLKFFIILYLVQTAFLVSDLGKYLLTKKNVENQISNSELPAPESTVGGSDIYYIILDEYGRKDVLSSYLGFDNSQFESKLREKGFAVLTENHSNYIETFLSLSSSLNFEYINYLSEIVGEENKDRQAPYKMIANNKAAQFLKSKGYLYIDFSNGWGPLRNGNKYADIDIVTGKRTEFSRILISTTALEPFVAPYIRNDAREVILSTFSKLEEIPQNLQPTFTFVHFIMPHGPYLFDKDGQPINLDSDYVKFDKNLYLEQLQFASKKALETIEVLLNSQEKPIIILASDHGPESLGIFQTEFNDLTKEQLDERFGNFIAVYPGDEIKDLDKLKSPVNLFRVIFNRYFDANLPLLEDKKFYASYEKPYKFIEINDQIGK